MQRLILLVSLLVIAAGCSVFQEARPSAAPVHEGGESEVPNVVIAAKTPAVDFAARVPTVDVGSTLSGLTMGVRGPGSGGGARARALLSEPPSPAPINGKQQPQQPQGDKPAPKSPDEAVVQRGPMLIYTAEITMAVFEVNAQLVRIEQIARDLGGFMAKRADRSITIRVPAGRFDEAVRRVESSGDMIARNVTAQDITEEFHDLELRLKNARATQARLVELLAKASKVEEAVMVERELDRVSSEVERLEGRIKLLRDRAAFSTITVTFQPKPKESVSTKVRLPAPWLYNLGLTRLLTL